MINSFFFDRCWSLLIQQQYNFSFPSHRKRRRIKYFFDIRKSSKNFHWAQFFTVNDHWDLFWDLLLIWVLDVVLILFFMLYVSPWFYFTRWFFYDCKTWPWTFQKKGKTFQKINQGWMEFKFYNYLRIRTSCLSIFWFLSNLITFLKWFFL